jgi:hypothetical protein
MYSAAAFHCNDSVQWKVQWTLCGVGVTASDGSNRTLNKMYGAAAFHCTDSVQWTVQWTLCGVGATD